MRLIHKGYILYLLGIFYMRFIYLNIKRFVMKHWLMELEAEKLHGPPPTSWRPRKASGDVG